MKTTALNYNDMHKFVNKFPNAYWIGWTAYIFTPSASAETSRKGIRFDGKWGFQQELEINDTGEWLVPTRYLKYV